MTAITRTDGSTVTYLSVADTAKLVRAALKAAWPDGRFRVRSKSYAGGASIDVDYTDGPPKDLVDAVVGPYAGAGFDGMIDLKYDVLGVVDADGKLVGTKSDGTAGSHGTVPAWTTDVPPGGRYVSFGADYVFVDRRFSATVRDKRDAMVRGLYGVADAWSAPPGAYRDVDARLGTLPFGDPRSVGW